MDDFKNKYMDDNDLSEKDTDSSDETETFDLKESTAGVCKLYIINITSKYNFFSSTRQGPAITKKVESSILGYIC